MADMDQPSLASKNIISEDPLEPLDITNHKALRALKQNNTSASKRLGRCSAIIGSKSARLIKQTRKQGGGVKDRESSESVHKANIDFVF